MNTKEIGNLPAFPIKNGDTELDYFGILIRDYFAAKAMQAFVPFQLDETKSVISDEDVAMWSYNMADAMLKAR